MNVVVLDPAEEEVLALREFHERIRPGLGAKFVDDFLTSVARIRQFPRRYAIYSGVHRVCPLRRFKIGIFYFLGSYIYIAAVVDLRRSRRYIKRRLRY